MWTVYILQCRDGTPLHRPHGNLPRPPGRPTTQAGGPKYTRGRTPVVPVYQELCPDRSAALRRERAIKSLSRPQKLALCRRNQPPPRPSPEA